MKTCHGPCAQGRAQCTSPQACELPDSEDRSVEMLGGALICSVAILVLLAVWAFA